MARDAPSIDAYGDGGFRLSGERREGSLLIVADAAQAWPVANLAELTVEDFPAIVVIDASGRDFYDEGQKKYRRL